jgi:hypothetical protein
MHSNFITPPDYIETIVFIDATEEQMQACATHIKELSVPYNIYFYNTKEPDDAWLKRVTKTSDIVLTVGKDLINPLDYFNK